MKVTIGHIVHYHPRVALDASYTSTDPIPLITYAALVVDINDDGTPVLRVFPGIHDSYIVDCKRGGYEIDGVIQTADPVIGHWNWPPRE